MSMLVVVSVDVGAGQHDEAHECSCRRTQPSSFPQIDTCLYHVHDAVEAQHPSDELVKCILHAASFMFRGVPRRIRTSGLRFRRALFCPLNYRDSFSQPSDSVAKTDSFGWRHAELDASASTVGVLSHGGQLDLQYATSVGACVWILLHGCTLVGERGFEPPTSRLSDVRSNQLSYSPKVGSILMMSAYSSGLPRCTPV